MFNTASVSVNGLSAFTFRIAYSRARQPSLKDMYTLMRWARERYVDRRAIHLGTLAQPKQVAKLKNDYLTKTRKADEAEDE